MEGAFAVERKKVVQKMMHYSRKIDQQPETYESVANLATKWAKELDSVKQIAETEKHLLGKRVPYCLKTRCSLIQEELHKLSQRLTDRSVLPTTASLVIEILAVHVGSLTMNGYDGNDQYAEKISDKAEKKDFEWKQRHSMDDDVTSVIRGVFKFSLYMNPPEQGCYCRQCSRWRDMRD